MRDIRNPIDLYERIQHEKRVHSCGILEAADRVEKHRGLGSKSTSLTTPVTTNGLPPTWDMLPKLAPEKGVQ